MTLAEVTTNGWDVLQHVVGGAVTLGVLWILFRG